MIPLAGVRTAEGPKVVARARPAPARSGSVAHGPSPPRPPAAAVGARARQGLGDQSGPSAPVTITSTNAPPADRRER